MDLERIRPIAAMLAGVLVLQSLGAAMVFLSIASVRSLALTLVCLHRDQSLPVSSLVLALAELEPELLLWSNVAALVLVAVLVRRGATRQHVLLTQGAFTATQVGLVLFRWLLIVTAMVDLHMAQNCY